MVGTTRSSKADTGASVNHGKIFDAAVEIQLTLCSTVVLERCLRPSQDNNGRCRMQHISHLALPGNNHLGNSYNAEKEAASLGWNPGIKEKVDSKFGLKNKTYMRFGVLFGPCKKSRSRSFL